VPTPLSLPFPPLVLVQSDSALTWAELLPKIDGRLKEGVSICIQSESGHANRGGYFFHITQTSNGFVFRTFDRQSVLALQTEAEVVAFINHCSGRRYDQTMWEHAQLVNLRSDEDTN